MKELRNGYGARALSAMTQCGIFACCNEAHLRVGHTHEDVDALFSLITAALQTAPASTLQTPRDLQRLIDSKLSPIFHSKGQTWGIELVEAVTLQTFRFYVCFSIVFLICFLLAIPLLLFVF